MPTTIPFLLRVRKATQNFGINHRNFKVPDECGRDAGFSAFDFGRETEKTICAAYGGDNGFPMYAAAGIAGGAVTDEMHGKWKVTTEGAAAVIIQAAGYLSITTGAGSGDDLIIKTADQATPAASIKRIWRARIKWSFDSRALTKFALLFSKDSNDPINTPTTDYVGIWHDTGDGVLLGKARGNGGTVATDTVDTLPTLSNDTAYELGMFFVIGDSAANSYGWFEVNGTRYKMSSAQLTQVFALVAGGSTTVCGMLAIRTGSAVSRVSKLYNARFEYDAA